MQGRLNPCPRTVVWFAIGVLVTAVVSACVTARDEPEPESTAEVTQGLCDDPADCNFWWRPLDDDPADPGPDLSADDAVSIQACARYRWFLGGANNCPLSWCTLDSRRNGRCWYS